MKAVGKYKWRGMVVGICLACCAWLIFFVWHMLGTRIIADASLPDGTRFVIIQKLGEPFSTSCYYQKSGKQWGWYYYNHEDGYVRQATTQIDSKSKELWFFDKNSGIELLKPS